MQQDHLPGEAETDAGAGPLRREEREEDVVAKGRRHAWSVSLQTGGEDRTVMLSRNSHFPKSTSVRFDLEQKDGEGIDVRILESVWDDSWGSAVVDHIRIEPGTDFDGRSQVELVLATDANMRLELRMIDLTTGIHTDHVVTGRAVAASTIATLVAPKL